MALLLHIETTGDVCSVALAESGQLLALKESRKTNSHAEVIGTYMEALFVETGRCKEDLSAIALSRGPGSYTGLRIGAAIAKGLCFALNKPLITVDTLLVMANGYKENYGGGAFFCPLIDARRNDVFAAIYDNDLTCIYTPQFLTLTETVFDDYLKKSPVVFFGSGAAKAENMITHPQGILVKDFVLSASYLIKPAWKKFNAGQFEDIAYFEPAYLKEVYFIAK